MQTTLGIEHKKFSLESFEGPLDLLLFLIQKNEVNIYDIPIAEITEQFVEYLNFSVSIDMDELTDFYNLAATLIHIKSRMLLPVEIELGEEFEDPRQELVERLIEYQKFKKYADLLSEREQTGEGMYIERKKTQRFLPFDDKDLWEEIDTWALLKTFSKILTNISKEMIFNVYEEVSVKEKITLMHELFTKKEELTFADLVIHDDSPMDIICAFLAILESVKFKLIIIYQNTLFGDIRLRRRTI